LKIENVLITGASGGIGEEFARKFAFNGYNVILVARNEDKLNALKQELENTTSSTVYILKADLSVQDEVTRIYQLLQSEQIEVDILINNAGFGVFGEFTGTDLSQELNMIDLNIKTLTHLTKIFLSDMVKRNSGKIMNVASTAAFQPGPLMAVYYATKAYVLSFSEALANELQGTNVIVSVLCPGATETGFSNRAQLQESKLFQSGAMNVKEVVEVGFHGLLSKETIIIPGMKNKLLANSVRFMPRKMVTRIVRNVQDRIKK
jgi:uncharacterized protein